MVVRCALSDSGQYYLPLFSRVQTALFALCFYVPHLVWTSDYRHFGIIYGRTNRGHTGGRPHSFLLFCFYISL